MSAPPDWWPRALKGYALGSGWPKMRHREPEQLKLFAEITGDDWRDFWAEFDAIQCDQSGLLGDMLSFVLSTYAMPHETPTARRCRREDAAKHLRKAISLISEDADLSDIRWLPLLGLCATTRDQPDAARQADRTRALAKNALRCLDEVKQQFEVDGGPASIGAALSRNGPTLLHLLEAVIDGLRRNRQMDGVTLVCAAEGLPAPGVGYWPSPPPGKNPRATIRYAKRDAMALCRTFEHYTGAPRADLTCRLLRAKFRRDIEPGNHLSRWLNPDSIGAYWRTTKPKPN